MSEFERDYLPVLRRMAKRFFRRDEDKEADALSYGWWRWRKLKGKPVAPALLAWLACLEVWRGKGNIPGPGPKPQPYEACTRGRVGLVLELYADRAPSTLRIVVARDVLAVLRSRLFGRRVELLDRFGRGDTHLGRAAAELGVSTVTIGADMSEIRRVARHLLRP